MKNLRAGLAVFGLAAVLALPAAAGAPAAPKPGGPGSVTARSTTAARDAIVCRIHTDDPHYSHHAHGDNRSKVNVVARVTCSRSVARLAERVALYKNGRIYKLSGTARNSGRNSIRQSAARRCIKNQKYTGAGKATVVFPPRYTPHTATLGDVGKTVTIRRCAKR